MTESTPTEWYYALHGERVGPRSLDEVRSLVASGVLDADSLVWTTGMREWARVGDMPIVSPAWVPPHAPPARLPDDGVQRAAAYDAHDAHDAPHPWRRVGARLADVITYALVAGMVVGTVAPELMQRFPADPRQINPLLNLAFFPALALVEGVILHLFGTTPGKALFSIRVTTADGGRLSLIQSFSRALRVCAAGLGLGLPVLSLVAPIFAYFRLNARGRTWWDESMDLRVEHGPISPLGAMAIVGVFLLFMLTLGSALSTLPK